MLTYEAAVILNTWRRKFLKNYFVLTSDAGERAPDLGPEELKEESCRHSVLPSNKGDFRQVPAQLSGFLISFDSLLYWAVMCTQ